MRRLAPLAILLIWGGTAACQGDPPPKPPPKPAAKAEPAKPPPKPPAPIRAGEGVARIEIGAELPVGEAPAADGERASAAGKVLYWSERGLEAHLDGGGKVTVAIAHGEGSDPFFRKPFEGKTDDHLGPGSSRAEVEAALGAPRGSAAHPSPFGDGRSLLDYPKKGIAFELGGGGKVLAVRVTAPAP